MRIFEVYLNRKKLCIAGIEDNCVLTAIIDYVSGDKRRLHLHVGALDTSTEEHLRWVDRKLHIGDEIRIRVGDRKQADTPAKRFPSNPIAEVESKKRYVRHYAEELGWQIIEPS